MSISASQQRTFLRLLAHLRPHWRRDAALPARIHALLASHREFGSRDRRLYRELIYTTLRYLPWIEPLLDAQPDEATRRIAWLAADTPATQAFRAAFATGEPPVGDKTELLPAWFRAHCPAIFAGDELDAQLRRAPLWLRLQTDELGEALVVGEFGARGWKWRRPPVLAGAIELLTEADVTKTDTWRDGRIEVQDLGSQLILESIGIERGGRWLDACAGAGGKTLQLARLVGATGQVDAFDTRPAALAELGRRARRARQTKCHPLDDTFRGDPCETKTQCHPIDDTSMGAIRVLPGLPEGRYDGVLVDAPCSGSGTWRRSPHLKWVTTNAQIARSADTQRALLEQFSARVKPGGRLVYATCSLSAHENEEVIARFLAAQREFQPEPFAATFGFEPRGNGLTIMPSRHDTDGFFVASLRRR